MAIFLRFPIKSFETRGGNGSVALPNEVVAVVVGGGSVDDIGGGGVVRGM